jgi:hypothetical protein
MRTAIALGALALGSGSFTVTALPRPAFPGPASAPSGPHRLVVVSSEQVGVGGVSGSNASGPGFRGLAAQTIFSTANRRFVLYGANGSNGRYLVAYDRGADALYGFDFAAYAFPPRVKAGEHDLVYEQPQWAEESSGVLYVENAHLTFAASSYGRNAYITAVDLTSRKPLWRSPALVGNALDFLVTAHYLITGYGFTDEPDYLYVLDRRTGRVVDRLLLPNAPETITRSGNRIHVRTYDHVVIARLLAS